MKVTQDACKADIIKILKDAKGKYLLPYQIFIKLEKVNKKLARDILSDRKKPKKANPNMGMGAGIYYSAASFIAGALSRFHKTDKRILKEFMVTNDLKIVDKECNFIVPGNKQGISIWAYKQ